MKRLIAKLLQKYKYPYARHTEIIVDWRGKNCAWWFCVIRREYDPQDYNDTVYAWVLYKIGK